MLIPFNKVIKVLIFSDFILFSGFGLTNPIFAIFVTDQIKGGDVGVAGIAIGIYWILKSLIQIPVGRYLDKNHGEKDDYCFILIGTFIASLTPLGFIFASLPWHIYLIQIIFAIAMAMVSPSWGGIFVRHIDKGKEARTWSFAGSAVGIGAGVAGIIGGIVAKFVGFAPLFIGVSILGMIATLLLFLISKDLILKPKEKSFPLPKIFG